MATSPEPVPIGAAYALAEAFTRDWWDTFPSASPDHLGRARHRKEIELPRAETLIRRLWTLPAADRRALASAIANAPGSGKARD